MKGKEPAPVYITKRNNFFPVLWDTEAGERQDLELWLKRVPWKRSVEDVHRWQLLISFIGACLLATFETHTGREAVLKRMSEA